MKSAALSARSLRSRIISHRASLQADYQIKNVLSHIREYPKNDSKAKAKSGDKKNTPAPVAEKSAGSHSIAGPKFLQYFESKKEDPYDHLPEVEVCFKITTIADVNVVDHQFFCEFILMYDWLDESLELLTDNKKVIWEEHFFPSIELYNCVKQETVGGASRPRMKGNSNRVTQTQRIAAFLRTQYDLRLYPFDHQYLEIQLKTRGISGCKQNVRLSNPVTWRGKKGHKLGEMVDWLAEWDIAKMDAAPDGPTHDRYRLQVCVLRDSTSSFWNLVLSLTCIITLSFTAFGLGINELADREQIVMTMLLATMTFKFVLSDHLPSVPYLTVMDEYVVKGLFTICLQGMVFCCLDIMKRHGFNVHMEDQYQVANFSEKADISFFVLLGLWQVKVHWNLYVLFKATTMDNFLANTNLRCVVAQRKQAKICPTAKNLENADDWQVYSTNQIYRPYPLPPEKDRYLGSEERNRRYRNGCTG